MGAIGRVEGEGEARVSIINFRSRYRRAPPMAPPELTLEIPIELTLVPCPFKRSHRSINILELVPNGFTLPLPTLP
ncbi:hypothetical protein A1k_00005 [Klebsiella phage VLCpiA1k]|nr:hypothetical protein A1k_00005 [Klebsiella phage VLCpiA1k]